LHPKAALDNQNANWRAEAHRSYRREGTPMTYHRLICIRTASAVLKTAFLKGTGINPIYRQ
jgi:hypothetical protein